MALKSNPLFGEARNLIDISIERIKFAFESAEARGKDSLYVAFSGGKDSIVIAHLCKLAAIPYTLNYNITGIDPPELIYFMRKYYPELIWHKNDKTMWQLLEEKGTPPLPRSRYCCSELKERGGEDEFCVTGVRWAESNNRKNNREAFENFGVNKSEKMLFNDNDEGRRQFEICQMKRKFIINPIIDWTAEDVWEFIHYFNLPYCKLYDEGYDRIGCIGCPLKSVRLRKQDFIKYPKFERLYLRAFDKMIANRQLKGMKCTWKDGKDVMRWWLKEAKKEGGLF